MSDVTVELGTFANRYSNALEELPLRSDLDLDRKGRTSLFPWRGQFSPELVEHLLDSLPPGGPVLDPWAGSGTTLFECARRDIPSIGVELNPAAALLASAARFVPIDRSSRLSVLEMGEGLLRDTVGLGPAGSLFEPFESESGLDELRDHLVSAVTDFNACPLPELAVAIGCVLGAGPNDPVSVESVQAGWNRTRKSILSLPHSLASTSLIEGDCRTLPVESDAASTVLGSPPYINVFNYHQNYRPAVEWLGREPLSIARAEIGSNRKHRGNRFLTVIQYPMDMARALSELRRVVKGNSTLCLVVGRESNVRGLAFPNGLILAAAAEFACDMELLDLRIRSFTNRFGGRIWEDILYLKAGPGSSCDLEAARDIGSWFLERHLSGAASEDVAFGLKDALGRAAEVEESPMFGSVAAVAG